MSKHKDRITPFSFGVEPEETPGTPQRPRVTHRVVVIMVILLSLIAGGVYVYVYHPHQIRALINKTPIKLGPSITDAYKWRGTDGTVNITDEPPPEGVPYEKLSVSNDTNILPSDPGVED